MPDDDPDTSIWVRPGEVVVAGSFDDMREHVTQQLTRISGENEIRARLFQEDLTRRFSGVADRTKLIQDEIDRRFQSNEKLLDERYETQTKALDAAFKAAEQAVTVALANAEKAVAKAESAADKRFDAVNEFRKTLSDQTGEFPTRNEVNARMDALGVDTARNAGRIADLELRLTSRLDRGEGSDTGAARYRTEQRLNVGAVVAVVAVLVAAASLMLLIFKR